MKNETHLNNFQISQWKSMLEFAVRNGCYRGVKYDRKKHESLSRLLLNDTELKQLNTM